MRFLFEMRLDLVLFMVFVTLLPHVIEGNNSYHIDKNSFNDDSHKSLHCTEMPVCQGLLLLDVMRPPSALMEVVAFTNDGQTPGAVPEDAGENRDSIDDHSNTELLRGRENTCFSM
ncbi:hypothetical protein ANCCAN_16741 [Ancylostoma caninum]|uniref:Uncharacterized protein n=1 Tax=Ancylostoma caninum TaxID=29170 RepID=A0A368G255_ANCCA|nr:hypothetical protein ANCCAN_16741 [Ancylostoma caninum]